MGHSMNDAVEMEMDAVYGKGEREDVQLDTYTMVERKNEVDGLDVNRVIYVLTVGDVMQALEDSRQEAEETGVFQPPAWEDMPRVDRLEMVRMAQKDFEHWIGSSGEWFDCIKDSVYQVYMAAAGKADRVCAGGDCVV